MFVDVVIATTGDVTITPTETYLQLNSGVEDYQRYQHEGDAPYGGKVDAHFRLRQKFTAVLVTGGISLFRTNRLHGRGYNEYRTGFTWSGLQFVETGTDEVFVVELKQDSFLHERGWYQGSDRTPSFGTGTGQFDLTTMDIRNIHVRQETLCTHKDVERLLMSHLQGRVRFADASLINATSPDVMSYDQLYDIIDDATARIQGVMSRWYETPLYLTDAGARAMLRDTCAKLCAVEILRAFAPLVANDVNTRRVREWNDEVSMFLDSPPELVGEFTRMDREGAIKVERG